MPPGCGVRLLATIGHLLEKPRRSKGRFFLTCPWKIDTNWFLCFGVAKIDTNLLEKPGKVRRDRVSAGKGLELGEWGEK